MVLLQSSEKREMRAAVPAATGRSREVSSWKWQVTCLLTAIIECAGKLHKAKELDFHVLAGTWCCRVTDG